MGMRAWAVLLAGLALGGWALARAARQRDDVALWAGAFEASGLDDVNTTPEVPVFKIAPPSFLPAWTYASVTAKRRGIDNTPPPEVWSNLGEIYRAFVAVDEGYPVKVTSAYRCPALNTAVGGVSNSRHQAGRALDLVPLDGDVAALEAHCNALGIFSVVLPELTWVHAEVAGDGLEARDVR